ncbi:thiamine pyrophosphate-binding protein [Marinibaculum pumilum]|uniref:Thiamine pyrophosphate-binding protein n=1 Tax=Marinibaculum pumilum TaxID=1766165 RepID=A0ABV7KZ28_9PROT
MKLSDYIVEFLHQQGVRHLFAITGGASIHMIHSAGESNTVTYICPHHEQGAAMAADAYARVTGRIGAAAATSGPGATNLITGICCSWFDSVPVLYLTGQVATFRFRDTTGVRQMGFQETQIVEMVTPITKYAVQVTDPEQIRYELEKAVWHAYSGRPGPVVVDIPDDLQRAEIDPDKLKGFTPPKDMSKPDESGLEKQVQQLVAMLEKAERPVLVPGWGVRLSGVIDEVKTIARTLQIPICPSWAMRDAFDDDDPLLVGCFGTHGTRYGNFAVQNADFILSIGARLSTRETGSPTTSWARGAATVIVDIDPTELAKFPHFGKPIDLPIPADARLFVEKLMPHLDEIRFPARDAWMARIRDWKTRYPICLPEFFAEETVNPYVFVKRLSQLASHDALIFSDTGCALAWMMQAFEFHGTQRFFHAFNNTPMGYALPAAIGGAFAESGRQNICLAGDGSAMLNIQELATVRRHDLPVKMFLINNNGFSMVQQTQEQWLQGKYYASSVEGGLGFPDFTALSESFGIPAVTLDRNADVEAVIADVLKRPGPVVCDVHVPQAARVAPQCKYGRPIEDSEPLLSREEFLANMIVPPMKASLDD